MASAALRSDRSGVPLALGDLQLNVKHTQPAASPRTVIPAFPLGVDLTFNVQILKREKLKPKYLLDAVITPVRRSPDVHRHRASANICMESKRGICHARRGGEKKCDTCSPGGGFVL